MRKPRLRSVAESLDDASRTATQRKTVPHAFVLEALVSVSPVTHPMFGCVAVYVEDKIVLILRDKRDDPPDNGVWLATTEDHHKTLKRQFPKMRSIRVLGKKTTGWQNLPADAADFEESVRRACDLILAGDPRIGKVPRARTRVVKKQLPRPGVARAAKSRRL